MSSACAAASSGAGGADRSCAAVDRDRSLWRHRRRSEVGKIGAEGVVELAGDVALEAAADLPCGLSLGGAPGDPRDGLHELNGLLLSGQARCELDIQTRNGGIQVLEVGELFTQQEDMVRLQPANATIKPIFVPARDVEIQGRLLAVLRKYR